MSLQTCEEFKDVQGEPREVYIFWVANGGGGRLGLFEGYLTLMPLDRILIHESNLVWGLFFRNAFDSHSYTFKYTLSDSRLKITDYN